MSKPVNCECDNKPQGAPPCPPGRCISTLTPEHLASEAHNRGTCLCGGDVQQESDFLAKSKAGEVDTKPFSTDWSAVAARVESKYTTPVDERIQRQHEQQSQDDRDALNEALLRISRLEQDGMIMRERIRVLERGQREGKP